MRPLADRAPLHATSRPGSEGEQGTAAEGGGDDEPCHCDEGESGQSNGHSEGRREDQDRGHDGHRALDVAGVRVGVGGGGQGSNQSLA